MKQTVKIGDTLLGMGQPVLLQTMWKERLSPASLDAALTRLAGLRALGCRLVRFAVPTVEDAETLGSLAEKTPMPLCADIHFDYKIALRCLDFPIAKLRINPGNIGGEEKVRAVLEKARERGAPIRIGVNAGSLPADLREKTAARHLCRNHTNCLIEAAERELAIFDKYGFEDVVVSMKASNVAETVAANREFARRHPGIPLHAGVTEAGPLVAGVVRNTAALVPLIMEGIVSTVRVSLSDTPENEVVAAREIVRAAEELNGHSANGVKIVSCPRCARCSFDTHAFTAKWQNHFYELDKNITVAVMGCAVNGPGEARDADLGITGAGNSVLIFKKGAIIRTINKDDDGAVNAAFAEELARL